MIGSKKSEIKLIMGFTDPIYNSPLSQGGLEPPLLYFFISFLTLFLLQLFSRDGAIEAFKRENSWHPRFYGANRGYGHQIQGANLITLSKKSPSKKEISRWVPPPPALILFIGC